MHPTETAVLLRHGVTKPTIDALIAAGYDGLGPILAMRHDQIGAIPGVAEADALAVRRLVGRLADVGFRPGTD